MMRLSSRLLVLSFSLAVLFVSSIASGDSLTGKPAVEFKDGKVTGGAATGLTNWGVADFDVSTLTIDTMKVGQAQCPQGQAGTCFTFTVYGARLQQQQPIAYVAPAPYNAGAFSFQSVPKTLAGAPDPDARIAATYADVLSTRDAAWLTSHPEPQNYYNRDGDKAVVFYGSDGKPLFLPLPDIDEDDTVYVVIVSLDDDQVVSEDRITTCSSGPDVRVGGTARVPNLAGGAVPAAAPLTTHTMTAQRCSSDQGIKASFKTTNGSGSSTKDLSIPTLPLYRLTLGLSLIYDLAHQVSFSTQTVKGNSVPSIVQDDHVTGLAAVGFVSLRLEKVDMSRARCTGGTGFWSSIGHCLGRAVAPAIGVNVTDPVNHLYAGLNVEPWPGLGLILGYHFQRTAQLGGGYQVGDLLPSGSVPTVMRWEDPGRNFNGFIGLNLDGVLLGKILTGFGK